MNRFGSLTLTPFSGLALAALLLAALVVMLGAYTRLVDAGLGCPDWPGCYGFLGVPMTEEAIAMANVRYPDAPYELDKAWPEMVHRYSAAILGLVILALALLSVSHHRHRGLRQPLLPLIVLAMVVLQGAFGALTVTLSLWPQVVTAHLLGGFATLSLLWLLVLRYTRPPFLSVAEPWFIMTRQLRTLAAGGLIVLVMQIALGGWVSTNYAALACPDFPVCHGQWWPQADYAGGFDVTRAPGPNYLGGILEGEGRIAIHMVHRVGALLVTLVLGLLIFRLWRIEPLRQQAIWLAAILAVQILLGISNVIFLLPLAVATAHNAVAAALLLSVVSVNYRIATARLQADHHEQA